MIRILVCTCILLSLSGSHTPVHRERTQPAHDDHNLPMIGPNLRAFVKLSPALRADLAGGAETSFLVLLSEQADLSHVASLPGKQAKGRAVYDALRQVSRRTQAPLRAQLDALGIEYRSFYIVNMLSVQGDASLALALAARPDVARLMANPDVRVSLPATASNLDLALAQPAGVEWGVQDINADDVWALGYTGQGIVVGGHDTGYDWDHPALKEQYRGWNGITATHDYNWHDAIHSGGGICGPDSAEPCDDEEHGTHTMGTIVGDDGAGNQIGVAPGARWMGCRNMDEGTGTPATYTECFEFFLAPYPIGGDPQTDGDPDLAPHVVNNSWTCPRDEGCGDLTLLRDVIETMRAAGMVVVVVAGNRGLIGCGSMDEVPALHEASFTIGSTDIHGQIAEKSSRGPVKDDGSFRPKPDVSAPGVGVRSCLPEGGYGEKDGTSMASPHVTGLVALLWSAAPHLIGDVDLTERVIQDTARPVITTACGGDVDGHPNNVYGWGIVDALAAVEAGTSVELDVSASAEPRWVQAGEVVSYSFAIKTAYVAVTGVVLSETLPLGATFAWASGAYTQTAAGVTWNLGALSPLEQVSVTLAVTIAGTLSSGDQISSAVYEVRSNEIPTPVIGSPPAVYVFRQGDPVELDVSLEVAPEWVQAGQTVSYTFVVSNAAAFAPNMGLVLSDVLPLGTTFDWASGDYTLDGRQVTWDLGTLGPQQQVSVTLLAAVGITVPSGTPIVNADYGARSQQVPTPAVNAPAVSLVLWRVFLPIILRE